MRRWFEERTHQRAEIDPCALLELKRGRKISIILPARNEQSTVGAIVSGLRKALQENVPLIDEVVVVDSRSHDATADRADAAGARVVTVDDTPGDGGKGEALHAGVAAMNGDLGVFLDADVADFDPAFALGLLDPLLNDPDLVLVKGFYDRPWTGAGGHSATGGGRVTELVARPHIARRAPLLSGFAQPLAGEVAFRRDALMALPFVSGYGVDIGLLLSVLETHGLDTMAQADLGVRVHRHQDLDPLGRMALQVAAAFTLILDREPRVVDQRTVLSRGENARLGISEEKVATFLLPAHAPGIGALDSSDSG